MAPRSPFSQAARTHPEWKIDFALFSDKFQHACVCHSLLGTVVQLEKHRVGDVKACKLIQCARRHNDLAAMVHVLSLGSWHHCNGVAAVIFIEAASCTTWAHHAAHHTLHRIVQEVRSVLELLDGAHRIRYGEVRASRC